MQQVTKLVEFRRCLASVLAALSIPSCAAFAAPTYTLETASLTGPGYDTASGGRYGGITSLNASGQIVGYSYRYASAGTSLGYDTWLHSGGTTKVVNLTGAGYEYTTTGGIYRFGDENPQLNAAGQVVGFSHRYLSNGQDSGEDVWQYSGGTTSVINLTGSGYEFAYSGGTYRQAYLELKGMNASGQAIGSSERYTSTGTDLGEDSWLHSGGTTTVIGLIGTGYQYTSSGTHRISSPLQINDTGQVVGNSGRFTSTGVSLGWDAWLYSAGTSTAINLTGTGYDYTASGSIYRLGAVSGLNASGQVIGYSYRYTSTGTNVGQDVWLRSAGTTSAINLTSSAYGYASGGSTYRYADSSQMNAAGQVTGYNIRYTSTGTNIGQDAWLYSSGVTSAINLTGSGYEYASGGGTYRYGSPSQLNTAGQVVGTSRRYTSSGTQVGQDVWLRSSGTTSLINLTGPDYEYASGGGTYRSGYVSKLNNTGQAVGYSDRYTSAGASLGDDAWIRNAGVTSLINPTGGEYEYTSGGTTTRAGFSQDINDSGQVIGYSRRYTAAGSDLGGAAWFYDTQTHVTTPLIFSLRSDDYALSQPEVLTEQGGVLGWYMLYSGSTEVGERAFVWTETDGFSDLGSLVRGGLTAAQWQSLADVFAAAGSLGGGYPMYIAGYGQELGESGAGTIYLLTPEPTSLAALSLLAGALLRRSRRKAPTSA